LPVLLMHSHAAGCSSTQTSPWQSEHMAAA
jgi:hypothetical protein